MAWQPEVPAQTVTAALAAYGWQAQPHTIIPGGNTNLSLEVQLPDGPRVLTLLLDISAERAAALAQLLVVLEANDFPTNRLERTPGGAASAVVGKVPVVAKRWLTGEVPDALSPAQLEELGGLIAQLHAIEAPSPLPRDRLFGLDKLDVLQPHARAIPGVGRALARLQTLVRPAPERLVLVHGDLFADNLVATPAGLHILDFESAAMLDPSEELGMAFVGLCSPGGIPRQELVKALRAGYDASRHSPMIEPLRLRASYERAALACGLWRAWQYHVNTQVSARRDEHRRMFDLADSVQALSAAFFD